ncbi:hypothetical protein SAMN02910289_01270 [Lachnospiraceae bacterium RM5]|nr:hypothetical protein SAMN02910289_01270 [Lachnospiraceae bacterium RM5]
MKRKENMENRHKKLKITLSILLILMIVILLSATFILPSFIVLGERQTLKEALKWQSDHYDTSFYDDLEKKDYEVESKDGYKIHAEFLKNPEATTKYIIISHGYTDNRMGALKYVPMYMELGFNCIIYDLRGHGENEKTITTYGILESVDLDFLISDTRNRYKDISVLGLHGESLGAATTITTLKYKPDVDFVVADCGFSDIENVLKNGFKNMHLPTFFIDLADVGTRVRYKYSLKNMRPIDSLKDNEIPILFIHGEKDDLILKGNSKRMSEATKGYSEIHYINNAGHAESILKDPDNYMKYVKRYLEEIGCL